MKNTISFIKNNKRLLIISIAVVTLTVVAMLYPEHTEEVARAFLILIGAM